MRATVLLAIFVLLPIAVGGLGLGGWVLYTALSNGAASQLDYVAAVGVASIPLLIGAVATGSIGIILAVNQSRAEVTDLLRQRAGR